jgi:protein TonB
MNQASIYQPRTASPTSLGLVVLIHGAAIAALVFAKMEMPEKANFPIPDVISIPIDKPPPEHIEPQPKAKVRPPKPIFVEREVLIPPPPTRDDNVATTRTEPVFTDPGPTAEKIVERPPEPKPVPQPVRRDARLDPSSELKPPYPISEQRAGTEGIVTLRVLIGPDGRVRGAEKVRATNDAFFQATLRHALRNWRFKPATLDGRPIQTSKVMTLHFTLEGDG